MVSAIRTPMRWTHSAAVHAAELSAFGAVYYLQNCRSGLRPAARSRRPHDVIGCPGRLDERAQCPVLSCDVMASDEVRLAYHITLRKWPDMFRLYSKGMESTRMASGGSPLTSGQLAAIHSETTSSSSWLWFSSSGSLSMYSFSA